MFLGTSGDDLCPVSAIPVIRGDSQGGFLQDD